ncbi:hypothetical protein EF888_05395 [Silicimonas algicola]|uniref:Multicopper oxidase n=1 Tax=Silicimonas algicola TaxID=1826607 RepID=A0A316GHW6_9RHOB|nr:multicopper oxidase domain-containing protein [Silicimonas algicola]AZQ66623.1 hypothetical protein EF888_05395 [Silicimonas algicola]PWK58970.1 multicopper oxidase [Silicimonas algicola]
MRSKQPYVWTITWATWGQHRLSFAGTVCVPPKSTVDVSLDPGETARWMLHCHHMPHLASGMMTVRAVTASA